ncbi:Scr1 family TA system antitoxin-like transcriptional regulator [Actinokineospora enzanensis]|uniref:Scr1 family TA system antitoxin-like transcriptional regulator n=1 Tax=Actinokineospora enzanensis TaxID=155975 RepID=UPI00037B5909|nr:Scr1 family TA system antitoxin-like transcriptional regulator [Actinokineospora enzanensis]
MSSTPRAVALGRTLRQLRQDCGISQRGLADQIERDFATLSRWETGERTPKLHHVAQILALLDIHGTRFRHVMRLAENLDHPNWIASTADEQHIQRDAYLALTTAATHITETAPHGIPPLLRTRETATAIAAAGEVPADRVDAHVTALMERQRLVLAQSDTQVTALIGTAALTPPAGHTGMFVAQLERLLRLTRHPRVELRVTPTTPGWNPDLSLALTETPEATVAILHTRHTTIWLHRPEELHNLTATSTTRAPTHSPPRTPSPASRQPCNDSTPTTAKTSPRQADHPSADHDLTRRARSPPFPDLQRLIDLRDAGWTFQATVDDGHVTQGPVNTNHHQGAPANLTWPQAMLHKGPLVHQRQFPIGRRVFAALLTDLAEAAGHTQATLACHLDISTTTLWRRLRGDQHLTDDDLIRLLRHCGVTSDREHATLLTLKRQIEQNEWTCRESMWLGPVRAAEIVWRELEAEARDIITFSPLDLPPELRLRAHRRRDFRVPRRRKTTPTYTHLIGEIAFIRTARDLDTTAKQIRRVIRDTDKPGVTIRMVPDAVMTTTVPYRVVTLTDGTRVAAFDLDDAVLYRDDPVLVYDHTHTIEHIQTTALTEDHTIQFLTELATHLDARVREARRKDRDDDTGLISWWTDHPRSSPW